MRTRTCPLRRHAVHHRRHRRAGQFRRQRLPAARERGDPGQPADRRDGRTLAAGIAAGLADRKRPFSLLRLTGARLATLRRVVALEGAVPLLAVAAVAIGTGSAGAAMFATEAQQHPMVAPGGAYYLLTAGGIVVALGIIAATFPLLARITGPEVARNE